MGELVSAPKPQRKRGWRYVLNLALAGLLFAFLVYYILGWVTVSAEWAHPSRYVLCCFQPTDMGLAYENVTFQTDDNLNLSGWYIPSRNSAAVILAHGMASNCLQVMRQAAALAQAGFGTLLFDLRAHGDSEGETTRFNGDDMLAALHYLQSRDDLDANRIGAFGFSLGGLISLEAAAEDTHIRAVVADGPGAIAFADLIQPNSIGGWLYFPFDALFFPILSLRTGQPNPMPVTEAVRVISPRPIFLIAAAGDEARTVQHFYNAASEPKFFWEISGIGHGGGIEAYPDEYTKKLVKFYEDNLLKE